MIAPRSRHLIAALTVFGASALAAAPAAATFPGRNGRIAYDDYTTGQIYSVNPGGSKRRQLTDAPKNQPAESPNWSANGSRIVFDIFKPDETRIWVMRADGSHERQILKDKKGFGDFAPAFTPDGRQIVFSRCHPEPKDVCAIWKMRANGTRKRALTPFVDGPSNTESDFDPEVSPNGRRIVFSRFQAGGFTGRVFVMGIDGGGAHAITPAKYEAFRPDWAPSGNRITFSSNVARVGSSIFTIKRDGSDVHRQTPDRFPHNDAASAYSPRGNRIVFVSDRRYPDLCCNDLFSIGSGGGKDRRLHTGEPAGILDPAWGTAPIIR